MDGLAVMAEGEPTADNNYSMDGQAVVGEGELTAADTNCSMDGQATAAADNDKVRDILDIPEFSAHCTHGQVSAALDSALVTTQSHSPCIKLPFTSRHCAL